MKSIDLSNFSIDNIPTSEDDYFEFKSSKIRNNFDSLAIKLGKAVSGFANSGGGYFIVGIDEETGNADGGLPISIKGRTSLLDWVDTIIHQAVEPVPDYTLKLISDSKEKGYIEENCAVLVVQINESFYGPHIVKGSYYIRAGRHTEPAKHFIVESIRAKRYQSSPKLTHLFRLKPTNEQILQLGILALTNAPATNCSISFTPLPKGMKDRENDFPIKVSVIDSANPFFFDISLFSGSSEYFGNNISLLVEYYDNNNNKYLEERLIGVDNATPPIVIGSHPSKEIVKSLATIEKSISKLSNQNSYIKPKYIPSNKIKDKYSYIENILSDLLNEMGTDLTNFPFIREFIIISKNWQYNNDPNNDILFYYFEDHDFLRNKIRILENCELIYEITYNSVDRFVMSEEFVEYLLKDK